MKKTMLLLMVAALLFTLTACGLGESGSTPTDAESSKASETTGETTEPTEELIA